MKLFPSFFGLTIKEFVDYEKIDNTDTPFKLRIINEESNAVYEMLGITRERGKYLESSLKKASIDCEGHIEALQMLEKDIKHINEFYMCVLLLKAMDEPPMMMGGFGNFMAQILGGMPPGGPQGPDSPSEPDM